MAKLIDGKAVSASVRAQVAQEVQDLKAKGLHPGLAVVIVGDDPASRTYVNNKKKACAETGIYSEEYALPATTTQEELLSLVRSLNEKPEIPGICRGFSEPRPLAGFSPGIVRRCLHRPGFSEDPSRGPGRLRFHRRLPESEDKT